MVSPIHNVRAQHLATQNPVLESPLSTLLDAGLIALNARHEPEYANPRACAIFGAATVDQLRARWDPIGEVLRKEVGTGEDASEFALTLDLDGQQRTLWCEMHAVKDTQGGRHLLLVHAAERFRMLDSAFRLASRYQTLSSLCVEAAHDFRGSLNALTLNLELLRELAASGEDAPDVQQRCLAVVGRELQRLERTVGALLEQNQLESHEPKRFDLSNVVRAVAGLLAAKGTRHKVKIQLMLPEHPIEIMGHADWMQQALFNLANNALEAMPNGGELRFVLARAEDTIKLTVSDTGFGIAPEIMNRIWDLSFTTKTTGNGIGLHVVKRILREHGGSVTVESRPGETSFVITLPAWQETP
jgi:signal transduction histidine kinase